MAQQKIILWRNCLVNNNGCNKNNENTGTQNNTNNTTKSTSNGYMYQNIIFDKNIAISTTLYLIHRYYYYYIK